MARTNRNESFARNARNAKVRARERAYAKAAEFLKDVEEQREIDAEVEAHAEALDRLLAW